MAVAFSDTKAFVTSVRGRVLDRSHPEYDLARAVYNGMIDRRPELIVRPLDAGDVARTLAFAHAAGLPIAVRGGGHNVAGHAVCNDGISIDLRLMRDVVIDPGARRADAGGGATWNDFDAACQRFGLATPGGTFGTTGIGGLTLGGGIGHLSGRFGLSLDNLVAAEVVIADGTILRASEEENADLFWALRGGGGNFGAVTRFVYRLHEVEVVEGGVLVFDAARAADVLRKLRELVIGLPDELTFFVVLAHDRATGAGIVLVSVCWTGSSGDARARLEELRSLPGLLVDGVEQISYLQLQGVFGEVPAGVRNYWKGHFVEALPDELIDLLADRIARRRSRLGGVLIEPLQGFLTRVPDERTAFANRHAAFNVTAISAWLTAENDEEEMHWARELSDQVSRFSVRGGGYVNYMAEDEPLDRVEAAFGREKFARLREVKRAYDPDNVFRQNQNIPPAV